MKYDNFGYFVVILGNFRDKTCIFGVEKQLYSIHLMKKKQQRETFLIFIKEIMMAVMCQFAVTEHAIGQKTFSKQTCLQ